MIESEIAQFLLAHGYFVMFVLMIVEGPIVTMAAAFLASMGYFSLPLVLVVSLLGDLVGDVIWYTLGRQWGMRFAARYGRYVGITPDRVHMMQRYFVRHGGKTIFAAKSTTGLCLVTFVAAGIAKIPLQKFLTYSFLGGIIWSSTLVILGTFFGALYAEIAQYISWAGWLIGSLALIAFILINAHKKGQALKFEAEE